MQSCVIDEDSLFTFERDVNEDDGYILTRKTIELDWTKDIDKVHCDNSLDDENNLDGVATSDEEDLEGAVKSGDNNVEAAVKSDDKEC